VLAQDDSAATARWRERIARGERFLVGANLRGADLSDLDLSGINILAADLTDANLLGTDLTNANMQGVRGVTFFQLYAVKSLYGAKLDPMLRQMVLDECPWKLEKPGEQTGPPIVPGGKGRAKKN
jgi:uncharacterized protein YjbI with pentapeptide repeats